MSSNDIALRLKKARQKKALSIEDAAQNMGISEADLILFESGKRHVSLDEFDAFAKIYNVSASYLKEGNVFIDHTNDLVNAFEKLNFEEQHDFIALFSTLRKPKNKNSK